MAVLTNEGSDSGGYVDDLVPEYVASMEMGELGSVDDVQAEIDRMLAVVRDFWALEPDDTIQLISAISARCTELHIAIWRVEGKHRGFRSIRTQQVDRLLAECDRQFKAHSRLVEMRRQDLDMEFGRGR